MALLPHPLPVGDAVATVEAWLSQPPAVVVEPTGRHLAVLAGLLVEHGTGGT